MSLSTLCIIGPVTKTNDTGIRESIMYSKSRDFEAVARKRLENNYVTGDSREKNAAYLAGKKEANRRYAELRIAGMSDVDALAAVKAELNVGSVAAYDGDMGDINELRCLYL